MKSKYEVKELSLENLIPNNDNPRISSQYKDKDNDIYTTYLNFYNSNTNNQEVEHLKKIIKNFFNHLTNEIKDSLIVYMENKKYIIFDGNTRYFSIYYLDLWKKKTDTSKIPHQIVKFLEEKNIDISIPKNLKCLVYKNKDDAKEAYDSFEKEKSWDAWQKNRYEKGELYTILELAGFDIETIEFSIIDRFSNFFKKYTNKEQKYDIVVAFANYVVKTNESKGEANKIDTRTANSKEQQSKIWDNFKAQHSEIFNKQYPTTPNVAPKDNSKKNTNNNINNAQPLLPSLFQESGTDSRQFNPNPNNIQYPKNTDRKTQEFKVKQTQIVEDFKTYFINKLELLNKNQKFNSKNNTNASINSYWIAKFIIKELKELSIDKHPTAIFCLLGAFCEVSFDIIVKNSTEVLDNKDSNTKKIGTLIDHIYNDKESPEYNAVKKTIEIFKQAKHGLILFNINISNSTLEGVFPLLEKIFEKLKNA